MMQDYDDLSIPAALNQVAEALYRLGNADAATPMGGLEAHGLAVLEAADKIRGGLDNISESIDNLADALARQEIDV